MLKIWIDKEKMKKVLDNVYKTDFLYNVGFASIWIVPSLIFGFMELHPKIMFTYISFAFLCSIHAFVLGIKVAVHLVYNQYNITVTEEGETETEMEDDTDNGQDLGLNLNDDDDWIKKKSKQEDGAITSAAGLILKVKEDKNKRK